jgi:hypothetical protein
MKIVRDDDPLEALPETPGPAILQIEAQNFDCGIASEAALEHAGIAVHRQHPIAPIPQEAGVPPTSRGQIEHPARPWD